MRVVRQTLMLLVLALGLVVPTASASDLEAPQARQAGQSSPDFLERLWQLFTEIWSDAGCGMDPLGGDSNTDAGGALDPLGSDSNTDAGGTFDPLG